MPVSVALPVSTLEDPLVVTAGLAAAAVAKLAASPSLVPDAFDATRRNQYVFPLFNPLTAAVTATEPAPDPASCLPVTDPSFEADVP